MNLHRSGESPDWAMVMPNQRNRWQRLAAQSRGLVTPGNIITVAGLVLVVIGLELLWQRGYMLGILALAAGRGFDLLDGLAAEATGTKSPIGETFDAAADKIATFLTLIVLAAAGYAPSLMVIGVAVPHIIIAVLAYRADRTGRRLHPSRLGKVSMAAAWVGLLMVAYTSTLKADAFKPLEAVGYVIALASIVMGLAAAANYYRTGR